MTLYVTRAIGCDFPDCDREYEGFPGQRADEVRREGRRLGWKRFGARDWCPKHAATRCDERVGDPMTPGEVAAIAAARATEGDSGDESFNDPIRGEQVTEGYTGRLCSKSFASNPANCTTPVPDAAGWGVCNTCGETLNITGELIPEHRTETPT